MVGLESQLHEEFGRNSCIYTHVSVAFLGGGLGYFSYVEMPPREGNFGLFGDACGNNPATFTGYGKDVVRVIQHFGDILRGAVETTVQIRELGNDC